MTAAGFLLLVAGIMVAVLFGDADQDDVNFADAIGLIAALAGSALMTVGIALWLWDWMP